MAGTTTGAKANAKARDAIHDEITRPRVNLEDLDTVTYLPASDLLALAGAPDPALDTPTPFTAAPVAPSSPPASTPTAHRPSGISMRETPAAVTTTGSVWPLHVAPAPGEDDAGLVGEMAKEHLESAIVLDECDRALKRLMANPTQSMLLGGAMDWFSLMTALRIELDAALVALRDPRLAPLAGPCTNLGTYLRGLVLAVGTTTRALARAATSFKTAVDAHGLCNAARDVSPMCFTELVPFILGELDGRSPAMANDGEGLARLREAVERSSWHATALRAAASRT